MITEVVLHIGMHKTGTCTIQTGLENYDDGSIRMARLTDINHSVPIYSFFSEKKYNYFMHHNMGRRSDEIDDYNRNSKILLENELALDREKLIISGEDISLLTRDEVFELVSFLKARASKVHVIAYVRDPEGFAASALQQYIQGGMRKAQLPTPQYKNRFSAFIDSSADSIEFVEFKKDKLHKGCVLQDFCNRIALDSSDLEYSGINASISLECAQLLYHFNQHGIPTAGNSSLRTSRKIFIADLASNINKTKFQLPQNLIWTDTNIKDAQWMESVSSIKLLPKGIKSLDNLNTELADQTLHELLNTISYPTLAQLQEVVRAIDPEIGKDCRVTNLLNFLFSQHYFLFSQRQSSRAHKQRRFGMKKVFKCFAKLKNYDGSLLKQNKIIDTRNQSH